MAITMSRAFLHSKPGGGGVGRGVTRGVVLGVVRTVGEPVIAVVGGVERVVTVDTVGRGGHVGSATSVRTYT